MADNRDIDHHSGVETTGHEWDGLKELNNPLPRWWILVFYACIVWAIGYWVAFPAWPMLSRTTRRAMLGYSERAAVNAAVAADKAAQSKFTDLIAKESVAEVNANPELLKFSMTAGRAAFVNNCAGCHGSGAQGGPGFPNLNDDNWLWGGTLDRDPADDHVRRPQWIGPGPRRRKHRRHARACKRSEARSDQRRGRVCAFALQTSTDAAAAERGKAIFAGDGGCNACHGDDAKGNKELGSANLTAGIFQWGGTKADIVKTITNGRAGVMPVWAGKLEPRNHQGTRRVRALARRRPIKL